MAILQRARVVAFANVRNASIDATASPMATPAVRIRISCKEASRAISQMQDGDIAFGLRLRLRAHLLLCVACLRFERQVRFLRVALRRFSR